MSGIENSITFNEDGLRFSLGNKTLFVFAWSEVREIVAYKEDLFGCDSICIGFRLSTADDYARVFEEAEGYKEMLAELELRFPEIRKDWFHEVAFPAFVPNWTTIWGEPLASRST